MKSAIREFAPNACIFQEGAVGNAAYILTEGSVEISVQCGEKKSVLAVLQPISVFGEMALLLKDQKRTATAQARTLSKVAEISRRDFDEFLAKSPPLITAVLNALVQRLQKTTAQVAEHPDLFLGIAAMLHLVQSHHPRRMDLEQVIQTLSDAFLERVAEVKKTLDFMETLGLIEQKVDGTKTFLEVVRPVDFLERARKIHGTFARLQSTTKAEFLANG